MYYLKGISALSVLIAMLLPVNPAWGQQTGEQVYNTNCTNCHSIGVPINGVRAPIANMQSANQADWNNRLTTRGGIEGIYTAILEPAASSELSYTTMCGGYSAEECKAATDYMIETLAGISIVRTPAVEDLYTTNCSSCHNSGIAINSVNAPIANMQSANQADWNTRLTARGGYIEGIYDSILASPSSSTLSYTNMCGSVEDEECRQITDYMIETLAGVSIVRESVVRDLYNTNCSSCHNNGVLNAPIANMESANQANWKNRLKERDGIEGIYTSIGSTLAWMCASVETAECEQIADYMIETLAGVSTEPEPPGTQIKLKLLLEGAINSSSE